MQFTIPANTPAEKYGNTFDAFCDWLTVNGVEPGLIDGTQLLTVTSAVISGTVRGFGGNHFEVPVQRPMPGDLAKDLTGIFFDGDPATDPEAAPLDDMAQWVTQLATARKVESEAKKSAAEAKDQIMARLRQLDKPYGSVGGQRVVFAKVIPKSYFDKAACSAANPGLVEKYTEPRNETRLEIL